MIRIGFCPYFQYVTDNALKQIHFAILMIGGYMQTKRVPVSVFWRLTLYFAFNWIFIGIRSFWETAHC